MKPEEAVAVPRFSTGQHEDSFNPNPDREVTLGKPASLTMDDRIDEEVGLELAKRGHKIETTSEPIAYPVMICVDPDTGMIYAAGDPRAKRHAAALGSAAP